MFGETGIPLSLYIHPAHIILVSMITSTPIIIIFNGNYSPLSAFPFELANVHLKR